MKILTAINYVDYKDISRKYRQGLCVSLLIQYKPDFVKLVSLNYKDDNVALPSPFIVMKKLKRDSSKEIGNNKRLPYIKEILDLCSKEDADIFGYINSDVLIEDDFFEILNGRSDVYLFQRVDISDVDINMFTKKTIEKKPFNIVCKDHPGFDGIFFDKAWWLENRDKFNNNMILGEPFWDYYYKEMAYKYSKKVLIQRPLYHMYHETKWNLISPGAENNKKIYDGVK